MPRRYRERRVYHLDRSELRPLVERAIQQVGLQLEASPNEWEVRASQSTSAFSWGERITVILATEPGGGTQLVAESSLVFGLFDWGRNQRHVESVLDAVDAAAGSGRSSTPPA